MNIRKINEFTFEIPKTGSMRVPGIIFASERMINHAVKEKAAEQVANVASMPGIVGRSMAMPDIHWGYGFPIGGVAAFDENEGVISPGGIGYDINCGVRLLRTNLKREDVATALDILLPALFSNIPSGVGSTGKLNIPSAEVEKVLEKGAAWAVSKGFGEKTDLENTEENGTYRGADPSALSNRAVERGREQLGTLGAGNHFLEIQEVAVIYDKAAAEAYGLFEGQITVMIHTGSRGLGYQVCDDFLALMQSAQRKYGIVLPDRQLACAPIGSAEGRRYFSAMAAAANYAWANRQIITHWARETFMKVLSLSPRELGIDVVYDVAHNIGKFEEHGGRKLFVHRKGATRAFGPGEKGVPERYSKAGQPVLVPGTMGTESFVLCGTRAAMDKTFGSTCHGAGRVMSRTQSIKTVNGRELVKKLKENGINVLSDSYKTLAEEAPGAYKVVGDVVAVCEAAGISRKVAKLKPLGVIKG
ncbi:MAG: RNA-splicing ligase RtcB [Elusimicrobia bacterium RIFOXYB12_FULL_50_12]|nr:MAG: RNA-splicing ligase RtcB [Elusimicrobia bacterium RIFOXYA12_FULL_49_49]OGS11404.1 MAG: RNA-splicing ligase RtcB [Elusimicrobia bacterium RIFOXYB1_FULL_48_9]OGS16497.1 MAG: RNA-splicing ligase RtcB [Elusimicrobia bacterium RIFOXYA2_FULL_47_53]OGS25892.1 MAG: RNA-splicing ligase RtcB [Elusimicrobia bacterium RIFOXYB12_FULL_50_12]OGS31234.1 MAG: RNA-splicing ligase RtcB [Elusimicrobia bacterium RIFOXYB2_FULL_46_23]